jgi:hypothetical protein
MGGLKPQTIFIASNEDYYDLKYFFPFILVSSSRGRSWTQIYKSEQIASD